jgi:hypothetical protein
MMHDSLANVFQTNFALMHHHKWSLTEVENLIPWEKEIYLSLLVKQMQEEERRYKEQSANKG